MRKFLIPLISLLLGSSAAVSGERVLYLGDSMSLGAFGRTFDHAVRAGGHEVFTVVAGGATPYYWLKSHPPILCDIGFWKKTPSEDHRVRFIKEVPKVEDLLKEIDPSIVVVQTGTNLFAELRSKRRSAAENERVVERLIEEMCQVVTMGDRKLYWISPPDAHRDRYPVSLQRKMASIMARVAGRFGEVFDSKAVTKFTDGYPETDGIHYGPTEARAWARVVAKDFSDYLDNFSNRGIVIAKAIPIGDTKPIVVRARPIEDPKPRVLKAQPVEQPGDSLPSPVVAKLPQKDWSVRTLGNRSVVVEIELAKKTRIPKVSEFTYRRALGIYEWKVTRCRTGNYPFDTIRVAHMICVDKTLTRSANFEIGKKFDLELVPLSRYPSLERLQIIDSLPLNLERPLFISKLD